MLQNLPELVLDLVCRNLSYEDVLALRSACKGLKQFADEKQFTKLHLFVKKFSCHYRLFYTGEWIGYPHSFHSVDLAIVSSNRFRERFRNVQKMTICNKKFYPSYSDETEFDLTSLNYFRALSHLEINEMPTIKGKLNLPELQIAAFRTDHRVRRYGDSSFKLNCPRLRALKIWMCKPVLTCETDQLSYLDHLDLNSETGYLKSINPNLRKLSTICLENGGLLLRFLFDLKAGRLILPSLSQILLKQCPALEKLDELANNLQDLRRDLRTKHMKFIFIGRLINSPDELSRIASLIRAHLSETEEEGRFINWIDRGSWKDRSLLFLNGTPELESLLSVIDEVELDEDIQWKEEMIKKLKNVDFLKFSEDFKPSVSTFELFARNCKLLYVLSLHNQTVTWQLLEMLSSYLLNLNLLTINECRYETLKPLAKFRNLEAVALDFNPPRDELTFIYENSRALENVYYYGNHRIELLRTTTRPKVHRITLYPHRYTTDSIQSHFEFDNFHSMIDYYHENGLFEKLENYEASPRLEGDNLK